MKLKQSLGLIVLIILIVLLDQLSKVYVKTHFLFEESVEVFSWFKIFFIENNGAGWGKKLSDLLPVSESVGKLTLTLFRIFAVFGIGYWLWKHMRKPTPKILMLSVSLIFAGALGNVIDSIFYGVIFDHSHGQVATLWANEPYGRLLYGKVVDMFYFPLIDTTWPEWVPGLGGKRFQFFKYIFNVADVAISTGVGLLIIFSKKAFPKQEKAIDQNV